MFKVLLIATLISISMTVVPAQEGESSQNSIVLKIDKVDSSIKVTEAYSTDGEDKKLPDLNLPVERVQKVDGKVNDEDCMEICKNILSGNPEILYPSH